MNLAQKRRWPSRSILDPEMSRSRTTPIGPKRLRAPKLAPKKLAQSAKVARSKFASSPKTDSVNSPLAKQARSKLAHLPKVAPVNSAPSKVAPTKLA
jgi:hypothetical protein